MVKLDLERLREVVLENRRGGEARPRQRGRQVFVDPSGRVLLGDDVGLDEGRQLSEVHQAVFAAPRS